MRFAFEFFAFSWELFLGMESANVAVVFQEAGEADSRTSNKSQV